MYRRARALKGIKKILIGSGLRYDLAVQSPEYVKELVQHHVGGYLKIAPEHTEQGPLTKMMKPGIGSYDKFKQMFDKYSAEAGKKQFLIPYFIAAHPGTSDGDMMNLALWLKKNGFRADQVQTFYPSPMATATAMYHSGRNTLKGVRRAVRDDSETVDIVRGEKRRRLHKAFLALPRSEQLAAAARGAQDHGPRRFDRQRQAPPDPHLPAADRWQLPECAAQEQHGSADRQGGPTRQGEGVDPAHRLAAACRCGAPGNAKARNWQGGGRQASGQAHRALTRFAIILIAAYAALARAGIIFGTGTRPLGAARERGAATSVNMLESSLIMLR
jgi:hypothetical protein